jgi:hypothetical protein
MLSYASNAADVLAKKKGWLDGEKEAMAYGCFSCNHEMYFRGLPSQITWRCFKEACDVKQANTYNLAWIHK